MDDERRRECGGREGGQEGGGGGAERGGEGERVRKEGRRGGLAWGVLTRERNAGGTNAARDTVVTDGIKSSHH